MAKKKTQTYEPIDDEMLWGVPADEQPQANPDRNIFDEQQSIVGRNDSRYTSGLENDY